MAKLFLRVCLLAGRFRVTQSGLHITWGFVSARLTIVSRYCSSFLSFSHRPDRTLLIIRGGLYLRFFIGLLSQPTDCIRRAEHKARAVVRYVKLPSCNSIKSLLTVPAAQLTTKIFLEPVRFFTN